MGEITKDMIEAGAKAIYMNLYYNKPNNPWEELTQKHKESFILESKAVLEAAEAVRPSKWQPIETAPKDGTEILSCDSLGYIYVVAHMDNSPYLRSNWIVGISDNYQDAMDLNGALSADPTHWMPLPKPPTTD